LISPYLIHGLSTTTSELDHTIEYARIAHGHALTRSRTLLFGFEVTQTILTNDRARDAFLNDVVELPEGAIYLRTMLTMAPQGLRQVDNRALLDGLSTLVASLTENDRPVLLPQSGLKGWLMMAFGAQAFGAGFRGSMQRCAPPGPTGGGPAPRLKWYFVPQLLGFVLAEELPALRRVPGFLDCSCTYCRTMPPNARAFDHDAAGKHFLWWCANLVNEASTAPNAAVAIRQRLANASRFARQVQQARVPLDDRSRPRHLEVWTAVVART
jgi:hypothetical protein